jgi:hypothetical protein
MLIQYQCCRSALSIQGSLSLSPHGSSPLELGRKIPINSVKFQEKVSSPTRCTRLLLPLTQPHHHQYNPCRGSSIGRACGSYNSKEINLKVVGSSPTFGYSYIKAHQSSCSFAFCPFDRVSKFLALPPAYMASQDTSAIVPHDERYELPVACFLHKHPFRACPLHSPFDWLTVTAISADCGNDNMEEAGPTAMKPESSNPIVASSW